MKWLYRVIVFVITALVITTGCTKSPLIRAVSKGDSSTVQSLIKEGSNINETDSNGATPLMYAIWSQKHDTAKTLINMGANVNAIDKSGTTALIFAMDLGEIELVKLLLSKGANINHRDKSGYDALSYATYNGHYEVARLLFYASMAMEKGGMQEVNKICRDFREIDPEDKRPYEAYINFRYLKPKISYKGSKILSIMVRDKRPYILSKEKGAGYVGLLREVGGVIVRPYTYDIGTLSRNSLANDFTYCIAYAFNDAGFTTINDFNENQFEGVFTNKKSASAKVDRIISIDIQEWMISTYKYRTGLYYDVTLKIFDGENTLLATTQVNGNDNLGGNSSTSMYEIVPTATKYVLSKMLDSPDIQAALKD